MKIGMKIMGLRQKILNVLRKGRTGYVRRMKWELHGQEKEGSVRKRDGHKDSKDTHL